jgi:hypothetical protein
VTSVLSIWNEVCTQRYPPVLEGRFERARGDTTSLDRGSLGRLGSPTVAYDELQQLLQLEFCSRATYLYWGVPAIVHQRLLSAPSKGRYFQQAIRGHFPYQRVEHGGAESPNAAMPAGHSR